MTNKKPIDNGPRGSDLNKDVGRMIHSGVHDMSGPARGSSIQGEHQDSKGGPAGANQGGASRGGSRVEPSHLHTASKQDQAKKPGKSDKK